MGEKSTEAREARIAAARRSPELANLHDESGWLALYSNDAVVEDPVGTPPAKRGVRSRKGSKDDLERFYAAFIAPSSIRVEERLDVVVGDRVVRDVTLHVKLPGGGGASIPAFLEYALVPSRGGFLVTHMRAYWDAPKNGRALNEQGFRGKLTAMLSGFRLLRVLGSEWTKRYAAGTSRGIRREGPTKVSELVSALTHGNAAALDALATPDATFEREGHAKVPLRGIDGAALALAIDSPLSSGFVSVGRCDARFGGTPARGMAFVTFDATTKKVASVRLVCE